jgi:hypothetical protein
MLLKIIFGTGTATTVDDEKATGDSALLLVGPLGLAALVVMLGLYIPSPLQDSLARAARLLGGVAP